jgi:hypothetical protein
MFKTNTIFISCEINCSCWTKIEEDSHFVTLFVCSVNKKKKKRTMDYICGSPRYVFPIFFDNLLPFPDSE